MKAKFVFRIVLIALFNGLTIAQLSFGQDTLPRIRKEIKPGSEFAKELNLRYSTLSDLLSSYSTKKTLIISYQDFRSIIEGFFASADLTANSCGNVNDYPHQMKFSKTGIPTIPTMTEPLDRMDYTLTKAERKETVGTFWSGIPLVAKVSGKIRTTEIRACIAHWYDRYWSGTIENGYFQIHIRLQTKQLTTTVPNDEIFTTPLIKTRRMAEYKYTDVPYLGSLAGLIDWTPLWDWIHPYADATIKDYINGYTMVIVNLIPTMNDNRISYELGDVGWYLSGSQFTNTYETSTDFPGVDLNLFNQVPALKDKILNYNEGSKEKIREFIISIFNYSEIKPLLSDALTNFLYSKVGSNISITDIYGHGNEVRIIYEPQ